MKQNRYSGLFFSPVSTMQNYPPPLSLSQQMEHKHGCFHSYPACEKGHFAKPLLACIALAKLSHFFTLSCNLLILYYYLFTLFSLSLKILYMSNLLYHNYSIHTSNIPQQREQRKTYNAVLCNKHLCSHHTHIFQPLPNQMEMSLIFYLHQAENPEYFSVFRMKHDCLSGTELKMNKLDVC